MQVVGCPVRECNRAVAQQLLKLIQACCCCVAVQQLYTRAMFADHGLKVQTGVCCTALLVHLGSTFLPVNLSQVDEQESDFHLHKQNSDGMAWHGMFVGCSVTKHSGSAAHHSASGLQFTVCILTRKSLPVGMHTYASSPAV